MISKYEDYCLMYAYLTWKEDNIVKYKSKFCFIFKTKLYKKS